MQLGYINFSQEEKNNLYFLFEFVNNHNNK